MNIFVTDSCPVFSAVALPDKLVNKMATESCQMISIIYSPWYHNWGTIPKKDGTPYNTAKGTHRNHPCTKWAAESYENLAWLRCISHLNLMLLGIIFAFPLANPIGSDQ